MGKRRIANKGSVQHQRDYRKRQSGLDIEIPPVKDPERRERCSGSLLLFAETYCKPLLYLAPADMHKEIAADFQRVALYGGRAARAAPRGGGKTIWCLIAILWAVLYGHRKFFIYACENHSLSDDRLVILKAWLERGIQGDKTLLEDFPEVTAPIIALEGRPQRAASLMVDGVPCDLRWTASEIVLPTVAGSKCSGARVATTGLNSGIRGSLGEMGRPDGVVIDDPMGDEAAASAGVINKRKKIINKGITQLVGMGKNISLFMLCTIIEKNDIGDQYTDKETYPAWNGKRYTFLYEMPEDIPELWKEYIRLRKEKSEDDPDARAAHSFYLDNRVAMDNGHGCTLPLAYVGGHVYDGEDQCNILEDGTEVESSAIQHAYNVIADDGLETFLSELQNEPIDEYEGIMKPLTIQEVALKENGLERGIVPHGLETVVVHVDCGTRTDIHYSVCAFGEGFTGSIIDWGTFKVDESKPADVALTDGLETAIPNILERHYKGERNGIRYEVQLLLIDSGYQANTVYNYCNRNPYKHITFPVKGEGTDNFSIPKSRAVKVPHGAGWWYGEAKDSRQFVYHVHANYWKDLVDARLRVGMGGRGCLSFNLNGKKGNSELIQSITSESAHPEFRKKTGETYNAWKNKINRRDNHIWDTIVNCHMAASRMGVSLEEAIVRIKTVRKRPAVSGRGVRRKY